MGYFIHDKADNNNDVVRGEGAKEIALYVKDMEAVAALSRLLLPPENAPSEVQRSWLLLLRRAAGVASQMSSITEASAATLYDFRFGVTLLDELAKLRRDGEQLREIREDERAVVVAARCATSLIAFILRILMHVEEIDAEGNILRASK